MIPNLLHSILRLGFVLEHKNTSSRTRYTPGFKGWHKCYTYYYLTIKHQISSRYKQVIMKYCTSFKLTDKLLSLSFFSVEHTGTEKSQKWRSKQ